MAFEVVLTDVHIQQLTMLISEIPTKWGMSLLQVLNSAPRRDLPETQPKPVENPAEEVV